MNFLPICVNVEGGRILIVGGGSVALHKLKALLQYTHGIIVCAPGIRDEIKLAGVRVLEQRYSPDVLQSTTLVYACTNDRRLNQQIRADAHVRGVLVNVADDPSLCDFISPAIYKQGRMSVAVSSNGEDVKTSLAWRDAIRALLQHHAEQP